MCTYHFLKLFGLFFVGTAVQKQDSLHIFEKFTLECGE